MSKKLFAIIVLFLTILSITVFSQDYKLDVVEYTNEMTIEGGWIEYFNITLKNTGSVDLDNVTIYFDGEFPQWFDFRPNKTDILHRNDNTSFMVKLSVPSGVESKTYLFTLFATSKETSSTKSFTVKVFASKQDATLYQIQQLGLEIDYLRMNASKIENSGKNVTDVMATLDQAKQYLETSKSYVENGEYSQATDMIINVNNLIKKVTYDLSIAPPKFETVSESPDISYSILFAAVPISAAVLIIFFVSRRGRRIRPVAKMRGAVIESKEYSDIEKELSQAENSLSVLEGEYKESLISKESYDELKERYDKIISDLKSKMEAKKPI
jgi:hypothetical protein